MLQISDDEELTLIDFPQMVSTSHPNAKELFERDVDGVVHFFERKLGYMPEDDESLTFFRPSFEESISQGVATLDEELKASGFKREHQAALERFIVSAKDGSTDGDEEEESSAGSEEAQESDGEEEIEGPEGGSHQSEDAEGSSDDASEGDEEERNCDQGEGEGKTTSVYSSDDAEGGVGALSLGDREGRKAGQRPAVGSVAARVTEQRRRAARRVAMAKMSRNATKSKNKGKKKGEGGLGGEW